MPYHGLAESGTLSHTSGNKTIVGTGGGCIEVRNPQAPGNTRTTEQQAADTTAGLEWRDYALLCGTQHAVNGGPVLGANKWLYCDANGLTWVVGIEQTQNANSVDVALKLYAQFGAFRKQSKEFAASTLASLNWTASMPTWYTGVLTPSDIVYQNMYFDKGDFIVPNTTGASTYINGYYAGGVGFEVNLMSTPAGTGSVISVLLASISGTGDPDNSGDGITATLVESHAFEGDLVTRMDYYETSTGWPTPPDYTKRSQSRTDTFDPPEAATTPSEGDTWQTVETKAYELDDGFESRSNFLAGRADYDTVLFVRHDGDIEVSGRSGGYATDIEGWSPAGYTYTINRTFTGGTWVEDDCTSSTASYSREYRSYEEAYYAFAVCGTTVTYSAIEMTGFDSSQTDNECDGITSPPGTNYDQLIVNGYTYAAGTDLADLEVEVSVQMINKDIWKFAGQAKNVSTTDNRYWRRYLSAVDGVGILEIQQNSVSGSQPQQYPNWSVQPVTESVDWSITDTLQHC